MNKLLQLKKDIRAMREKLIEEESKHGMYENFGGKEIRTLEKKYNLYGHFGKADTSKAFDSYSEKLEARGMMLDFGDWCANYCGKVGL